MFPPEVGCKCAFAIMKSVPCSDIKYLLFFFVGGDLKKVHPAIWALSGAAFSSTGDIWPQMKHSC